MRHKVVDIELVYPMSLVEATSTCGVWRQFLHHNHKAKGNLLGNSSEANCLGEKKEEGYEGGFIIHTGSLNKDE
jgi:hypothetical protein